ncbi:MAG: hypothetical protein J0H66_11875 [Solirubrobacterales bacterium]|nr:hypothetical protein [Solirubrobacterales bacterium]OJU93901.1 MAG: hypothetical protein BGO23_14975 [Solirubrobacterales bacterium 67-14]
MSVSHEKVDRIVRQRTGAVELSKAESEALWDRIVDGIEAADDGLVHVATGAKRRGPRRVVSVGVLAVLAVGITVFGIHESSDRDATGLAGLASASASEVLDVTADSASNQASLVPGTGEALYYRVTTWVDESKIGDSYNPGGVQRDAIEEWIGPNGRGFRINGYSESSSSIDGDVIHRTPNLTPFDAEDSIDQRVTLAESWRAIFSFRGLKAIPDDPDPALADIRGAVARRLADRSQGAGPSTKVLGSDFAVLMSLSNLLMEAPLTGDQRSTLYELIATAPGWYRNDGSAKVEVANEGQAKTDGGQEGILISTSMDLSEDEARIVADGERSAQFEILIDPQSGSVLETRIVLGEDDSPAIWFTSDALELRTAAAMDKAKW